MARYLGPRLRITRRLGHLSGLTRKKPTFKPLNPANPLGPRKIIPPGQHGRNKNFKKKPYESCEYDYLIRLKLKQRLRFHYGLTERQLVRYVQQAKKIKGSTGRVLLSLLEMRLDNIVFRLHMAPTIKAARQLINHGHILVNKRKVTIPSYQCEAKDVITVAPKIRSMELVSRFLTEFEREKARYQRLLNILEYGKRGITMPTKELYSTKKDLLKTYQNRKNLSVKTTKLQSLKIGSILNVQVKQQGRYEAEAIANAYGKMIVIHPLFIGKQSINKKIRVIIYKKSQNNKILYAYPVNPFYLRLENLRQLNSLDVARIFGRYTGSSFNRSAIKFSTQKKLSDKKPLSSLILINGVKTLPKNILKRRQRFNIIGKEKDSILNQEASKKELTNQIATSILVRIIAAKCLNTKLNKTDVSSTALQNNLKDPVSYREKFVYTQTSRTLRQFGTRFYAQILKDQSAFKNVVTEQRGEKFVKNQQSPRSNFAQTPLNEIKMPLSWGQNSLQDDQVKLLNSNVENFILPKSKAKQTLFDSKNQTINYLENTVNSFHDIKNDKNSSLKLGRGLPELSNLLNKQNKKYQSEQGRIYNVPGIFTEYVEFISKLGYLKKQKNLKTEIYNELKVKIFTNLLASANKLFLTKTNRNNFIFVLFYKIIQNLGLNKNEFKNQNFSLLANNIQDLFLDKKYVKNNFILESDENIFSKYSDDIFVFNLKIKSILTKLTETTRISVDSISTSINNSLPKSYIDLVEQKITNNLKIVLLLDKIKNKLHALTNFSKDFFSSDIKALEPNLKGVSLDLLSLKTTKLINQIIVDIISTVRSLTILSKFSKLKSGLSNTYNEIFKTIEKRVQNLKLYKKVINFFMLSLPKSVCLSQYDSTVLKYKILYNNNHINDFDYYQKKAQALNALNSGFINQQKIQLITTLEFLSKFNFLNSSISLNISKLIKFNLFTQNVFQTFLKESVLSQFKINELNKKITLIKLNDENVTFENLLPCKITSSIGSNLLQKQTNYDILLLSNLEQNIKNQGTFITSSVNSSNNNFAESNVVLESRTFSKKVNNLLLQKKVVMKLLKQKNKIFFELNLLKQYNLITFQNFEKLESFLQNKFNLLEKLIIFSHTPGSKTRFPLLKKLIKKQSTQIVQTLSSSVSVWKILFLQKQKSVFDNDFGSIKQIILKNIINFKLQFTKKLINKFMDSKKDESFYLNNIFCLIKDGLNEQRSTTKLGLHYEFISQIYTIYILDSLKNSNIIKDQSVIQILAEIKEKFSTKKLMQTNIILTTLINSLNNNGDLKVIALDNFVQNVIINSPTLKTDLVNKLSETFKSSPLQNSKFKNLFWKQILVELTPQKIKQALQYLNNQNIFSFIPSSAIIKELDKLTNLYNQNKLFNFSLNKQYVKQKLQSIKNLLSILCENLNTVSLEQISLFKTNAWGIKKRLSLELLQQSKLKILLQKLENQKNQLTTKIQKLTSSQHYLLDSLNSIQYEDSQEALNLILGYLENQYRFIISKSLINVSQDSNIFLTGKISETENVLKNIKLYLLRYKFINQTLFANFNLARIYSLRKQRSIFINKHQYQLLKNSWENFVVYKNSNSIKTVLENNNPILIYLNKELAAKLNYKLSYILDKDVLTKTEYSLLSNTVKKLTNTSLLIKLASNWISEIKQLNLNNINNGFLIQKIILNYSVQNTPVYYNLPNDYSSGILSNLDLISEKGDWFKLLTDFKSKLNRHKLQNLNSQGWIDSNKKMAQYEVKFMLNQTFNSISLIEYQFIYGGLSGEFLLNDYSKLKLLKRSSLKYLYKNLKKVIYYSKLNILKERQLITEEQFLLFKQNYENLVQLVQQALGRLLVLNARRKWKFINYRKYQTLSQGILNNLSLKISYLLSKNNIEKQSLKSNFSGNEIQLLSNDFSAPICYLKNIEQFSESDIIQKFAQIQNQKINKNRFVNLLPPEKQSSAIQYLIQETLEQLLENSESNTSSLILRFMEKSKLIGQNSQSINDSLKISSLIELKNLFVLLNGPKMSQIIKLTLQRLNYLQKQIKVKGPWLLKDEQTKKFKQIIFQNFVYELQKITTENQQNFIEGNVDFTSIWKQKFALSVSNFKEIFKSSQLNSNYGSLNINTERKFNSVSPTIGFKNQASLLKQLSKIQSHTHKLYLQKCTVPVITREFRLSLLIKSNILNLSQSQQIQSFANILTSSNALNSELNTSKIECELILQNLINKKFRKTLESELYQCSQFVKYEVNNNLLSQKIYNKIKVKMIKLLSDSFQIQPSKIYTSNSFFNDSNNVILLAKSGLISETMCHQLIQKMKTQLQKQKIETIIFYLSKLQKQVSVSNTKKSRSLYQSLYLISVLAQLSELKQTKQITERQYLSIKQKLKQLRLLSVLTTKLEEFKRNDSVPEKNVMEFRQQIIQKIQQKIKKAKTLAKFQLYLNSISEIQDFTIKNKKMKTTTQKSFDSIIANLQSSGRWGQVTLKQLAKQKLINSKQEVKFSKLLNQQTTVKIQKLRNLIQILSNLQQLIQSQTQNGFKNSNYEQQILNIMPNLLKSLNEPWKLVILKQLHKQELISQSLFYKLQQSHILNNQIVQKQNSESSLIPTNLLSSENLLKSMTLSIETSSIDFKLQKLLQIYHKQIIKLHKNQNNRSMRKIEFEKKFKFILSNVLLLLETGGLKAFKVIYNTNLITELSTLKLRNSAQKRNLNFSFMRDFSGKYEQFKTQYLNSYQKLELKSKIKLFNEYKSLITRIWSGLENNLNSQILNVSSLLNLKNNGLVTTQQYVKLKVLLKNALQRLVKLDQIFITQSLYLINSDLNIDRTGLSQTEIVNLINNSIFNTQYLKLQTKIVQSYLKIEYKQVEKNIIKQKYAQQQLNSFNLSKKSTKLLKARLKRKQSLKQEQFTGYFQQLITLLDSRYKAEGRNRRGPRINSIYRQLNQKLAFDPTLTKKFGIYLQTFIEKRFGPALPIPSHLELKRWKVKNAQLQKNQKYLILPVGIVHDIASRRSVGLPILERLIVEYYSRN
uniref:Small ribosomal subunit protein uS4c n=1 Tax=Aphanochaete elegans TaxID=764105 RepID=A0A6H1XDW0_9CHLO|nr:ribosomal protein S4 [Aphanochaete elegans]QJA13708.1 ribosomal protein S4 [Aphanochaete elegans]